MCILHRNYRNNMLLKIKTDVPMVYNGQLKNEKDSFFYIIN